MGKLHFLFQQYASSGNICGYELIYNCQNKLFEGRIGIQHSFSNDCVGKVKMDSYGKAYASMKYKVGDNGHLIVSSGINAKAIAQMKEQQLPFGIAFDFIL
jgi:hypothetical protein